MQIRNDIAREDGILLCPEGAATAAAYQLAMEQGWSQLMRLQFCSIVQLG